VVIKYTGDDICRSCSTCASNIVHSVRRYFSYCYHCTVQCVKSDTLHVYTLFYMYFLCYTQDLLDTKSILYIPVPEIEDSKVNNKNQYPYCIYEGVDVPIPQSKLSKVTYMPAIVSVHCPCSDNRTLFSSS
jgi:hypothetical protein